jgi:Spy/CpxP family protein refolding chaperone
MIQRSKTFALALLAAVFVAGGAAGWLVHDAVGGSSRRHGRRDVEALLGSLDHDLRFTPAQRDSVRAILVRRRDQIRALWGVTHPQYDSIRVATQNDIDSFLTPEQVEKHRKRIAEWEERHPRDGDSGGPR